MCGDLINQPGNAEQQAVVVERKRLRACRPGERGECAHGQKDPCGEQRAARAVWIAHVCSFGDAGTALPPMPPPWMATPVPRLLRPAPPQGDVTASSCPRMWWARCRTDGVSPTGSDRAGFTESLLPEPRNPACASYPPGRSASANGLVFSTHPFSRVFQGPPTPPVGMLAELDATPPAAFERCFSVGNAQGSGLSSYCSTPSHQSASQPSLRDCRSTPRMPPSGSIGAGWDEASPQCRASSSIAPAPGSDSAALNSCSSRYKG